MKNLKGEGRRNKGETNNSLTEKMPNMAAGGSELPVPPSTRPADLH